MCASAVVPPNRVRSARYIGMHCAPRRRKAALVFALAAAALIAAYPLLSEGLRMYAFLAVSFASVPAVVVGLRRTPAENRGPWWFLFAALIVLNADNLAWYWYVYFQGLPTADGTISDLFATTGHILMLTGATAMVIRRGRNDIGGLIDTSIVAMAAGGLLWDFVLLPHMAATGASAAAQLSMCVDVFVLTGVLGALTRLLSTAGRVIPALWMLVMALGCALAGNIAVTLTIDPATGAREGWTDMVFMGSYTALALCGLSRSSAGLLRPGPAPADDLNSGRLAFLGVALAALPIVGGGRQILGLDVDGPLLAIGTAAITPLVMIRIGRLSTQRAEAERALRHQAMHDALTGLPNRREFTAQLSAALEAGHQVVLLFCDLDDFKAVNDRLGHAAGDQLLVEVARRLSRVVREGDVVSRFGGDEFLILCPDAPTEHARDLVMRIERAMIKPVDLDDEAVLIGASIGAVTSDRAVDAEQLVHRADAAMYEAKQNRRDIPSVNAVVA